jgi:hypothetical protein
MDSSSDLIGIDVPKSLDIGSRKEESKMKDTTYSVDIAKEPVRDRRFVRTGDRTGVAPSGSGEFPGIFRETGGHVGSLPRFDGAVRYAPN